MQGFSINNVTAFHCDPFAFANIGNRKETAPMNFALVHFRFCREVRHSHHHNRLIVEALVPSALASTLHPTFGG
jgi:hypothetical protein